MQNKTILGLDSKKTSMNLASLFSSMKAIPSIEGTGQLPYGEAPIYGLLERIQKGFIKHVSTLSYNRDLNAYERNNVIKFDIKKHVEELRKLDKIKDKELYDFIKSSLPCVTWGLNCKTGRKLSNASTELTGFFYFDIDGNFTTSEIETKKQEIFNLPFVVATWKSVGGKGLGGLVYFKNFTKRLAKGAFEYLNEKIGGILDKNCKDITRLNVLSHDPEILIRKFEDIEALDADEIEEYLEESIETKICESSVAPGTAKNNELTAFSVAFKAANKRHGIYNGKVDGNRTSWIVTFSGLSNSFGIPIDSLEFLLETNAKNFRSSDLKTCRSIYKQYKNQFATIELSSIVSTKRINAERILNLKSDQKLSDLNLSWSDINMKTLVAPTGSGKSYFAAHLPGKKIFVTPGVALAKEFAHKYNGIEYSQNNKKFELSDDFIVSTYASLHKLMQSIKSKGGKSEDYSIIIDESHNFVSSASKGFMLPQLTKVLKVLKHENFQNKTLLTATPLISCEDYLNEFKILKVEATNKIEKKACIIKAKESNYFIKNLFHQAKESNNTIFAACLFNNTKDGLDSLKASLADYNIQYLSSDQRTEEHFGELITSGKFKEDILGIVSTSVIKEGNSFEVNDKDVIIAIKGDFHAIEIEQFSARFRDAKSLKLFIIKSEKWESAPCYFNSLDIEDSSKAIADAYSKTFNQQINILSKVPNHLNIAKSLAENFECCTSEKTFVQFNDETESYEIDNLRIGNEIYKNFKSTLNSNADEMFKELSQFNWISCGISEYDLCHDKIEKSSIKRFKEIQKASKQEAIEYIFNSIQTINNIEEIENEIENETLQGSSSEQEIKRRINHIYQNISQPFKNDVEFIKDIVKEKSKSTQSWNKFSKQIKIEQIFTNSSLKSSHSWQIINSIKSTFIKGEKLKASEIQERLSSTISNILQKTIGISPKLSEKKIELLFNLYFEFSKKRIKTRKIDEIGNTEEYYETDYTFEILSNNPIEFMGINEDIKYFTMKSCKMTKDNSALLPTWFLELFAA